MAVIEASVTRLLQGETLRARLLSFYHGSQWTPSSSPGRRALPTLSFGHSSVGIGPSLRNYVRGTERSPGDYRGTGEWN